jgi:hypothetical protein
VTTAPVRFQVAHAVTTIATGNMTTARRTAAIRSAAVGLVPAAAGAPFNVRKRRLCGSPMRFCHVCTRLKESYSGAL